MITIPKKIDYALCLLFGFSKLKSSKARPVSITQIANKSGMPLRFLSQIAANLKNDNFLHSQEGIGGGYWLAEGWEKKTLWDLVVSLGEDQRMVECLGSNSTCQGQTFCGLKHVWARLEKGVIKEFAKIKLKEFSGNAR